MNVKTTELIRPKFFVSPQLKVLWKFKIKKICLKKIDFLKSTKKYRTFFFIV